MKNIVFLNLFLTLNAFANCYSLKTQNIQGVGYPGFSQICIENDAFVLYQNDGSRYFQEPFTKKFRRVESTCGKEHDPCVLRVFSHYETKSSYPNWAAFYPNSTSIYRGNITVEGTGFSYEGLIR